MRTTGLGSSHRQISSNCSNNLDRIDAVRGPRHDGTIDPNLSDHTAKTFEDICQEAVWEAIRRGDTVPYSEIGRWWYDEDEIDIVGLAPEHDRILFAECKWTNVPVGHALAPQLRDKAEQVRWGPDTRAEDFVLFSKSGFVDGFADDLDDNWSLYRLHELAQAGVGERFQNLTTKPCQRQC